MLRNNLKTYDATRFDWSCQPATVDASDLGIRAVDMPFAFGPIYSDAADIGMALYNAKTDKTTVWVMVKKIMAGEDVGGWEFGPTKETIREFPQLAMRRVIIWND